MISPGHRIQINQTILELQRESQMLFHLAQMLVDEAHELTDILSEDARKEVKNEYVSSPIDVRGAIS